MSIKSAMPEKNLIEDPESIQLNELGEIQQILGHPPGWMLRWGISMAFVATAILLVLAWMIKYPDVVPARAIITTENPPVRVKSPNRGKIMDLFVEDGLNVEQGQLLAILENPANKKDIDRIQALLQPISEQNDMLALADLALPDALQLGTLQSSYSNLSQNLSTLQYSLSQGVAKKRIRALSSQKSNLKRLEVPLQKQTQNLEKERDIAQKNLEREKLLRKSQNRSDLDVERAESRLLQAERALENSNAALINNQLEIDKINSQILELREIDLDAKNDEYLIVQEDIQRLLSEIESWKQSFLVEAPIDGSVNISKTFVEQRFVELSEELMTIVPNSGTGDTIAKAALSPTGMGKVEEGMKVRLRLDGYPYKEFGMVKGIVNSIAMAPNQTATGTAYEVIITFPESLSTTYKKRLSFRQEMEATANIITKDRNIISRILDHLFNLTER